MFSLSKESEEALKLEILTLVGGFLTNYPKPNNITGLMTAKQVQDELGIKEATLKRWEAKGLKRYTPPIEDTRKAYYRIVDVLAFLGIEE